MRIRLNKILLRAFLAFCLTGLFLATSDPAQAKNKNVFTEETKKICNEVILNIYYDILEEKERYRELVNFDENALYENKHGIYTIIYKYDEREMDARDIRTEPFTFGVTIDGIDEQTFQPQSGSFDYGFPAIGLKMSGYQRRHILRTQFDLAPLIEKHGMKLMSYQQNFLPLRLYLNTLQDQYTVGKDIEFEVVLKNVSKRHMWVKSLGQDTLYFLFNNEFWGTNPLSGVSGGQDVILRAGKSISMRFRGEGFKQPKDFEIYAVYRMSVSGVNPSGLLKVKVIDASQPESSN